MTQKRHISELGLRVATAVVLIPLVLWLTVLGGIWFQLMILILGVLLANELVNNTGDKHSVILCLLTGALFLGSGILGIYGYVLIALGAGIAGALISVTLSGLRGVNAVILGAGIVFGNTVIVSLITMRSGPEFGLIALLWLFGVVWSADTMAYFTGRLIGGPKLAPKISPGKTWAGFLGGVAGAALAGGVIARLTGAGPDVAIIALSALAAIVAQAGDLQESWAKRRLGIKDSGTILPGHGGIWDRLDALIAVAIFATVIGLFRGNNHSIAYNLMVW